MAKMWNGREVEIVATRGDKAWIQYRNECRGEVDHCVPLSEIKEANVFEVGKTYRHQCADRFPGVAYRVAGIEDDIVVGFRYSVGKRVERWWTTVDVAPTYTEVTE